MIGKDVFYYHISSFYDALERIILAVNAFKSFTGRSIWHVKLNDSQIYENDFTIYKSLLYFSESVANEQHYHRKRIRAHQAYQVKQYQLTKFLPMKWM
jgi:hypothetical protein